MEKVDAVGDYVACECGGYTLATRWPWPLAYGKVFWRVLLLWD
jgi:hypothetical protein